MKPGAQPGASKQAESSQEGLRLESVENRSIQAGERRRGRGVRWLGHARKAHGWLAAGLLLCALCGPSRAQEPGNPSDNSSSAAPTGAARSSVAQSTAVLSGVVRGTVVDQTGTPLAGVHVRFTHQGLATSQAAVTGEDGQFEIVNATPGEFQLTFTASGFRSTSYQGTLKSGEVLGLQETRLELATQVTEVRVEESTVEIAQQQIQVQEKQRILGAIPNFYVTYEPNPAPLNTKQKYELAWKSTLDPISFVVVGGIAGAQQATDAFSGYGQGAQGYAKRFGATYADILTGTFIGGAILPSIMKQDPRYIYKGTGTFRSRFWYAISNAMMCKGDNGKWQVCYSSLMGSLAAGGISNAYYPESDRGAALTFENFGIGVGATAGVNLLQEFVLRKLTPHAKKVNDPANP